MGESQFASLSVAVYGVVLLFSGVAYTILVRALLKNHDADSALARAIGSDFKGKVSIALYAFAIPLAFILPVLAGALYVSVAIIWFVPDKRFERELKT